MIKEGEWRMLNEDEYIESIVKALELTTEEKWQWLIVERLMT